MRKRAIVADLSFLALVIELFICVMFIVMSPDSQTANIISFCVVCAIMMVTYFSTIVAGLVVNMVAIFLYASALIYQVVTLNTTISSDAYFWMIMSPVMTICVALIFRNTRSIERQNQQLTAQVEKYSTIDEQTGLKNRYAYELEMMSYRAIAKRYNMQLMLVVWEFRHPDEMKRFFGKQGINDVAVRICQAMRDTFRKEDVVYFFSSDPYMWGTLMLTAPDCEQLLMQRIRSKLSNIDMTDIVGRHAPRLEVRIGTAYDDSNEILEPEHLLTKARARMEYDV